MKLASLNNCTACMACVDSCSRRILQGEVDADGYFKICISNREACVECGSCTNVCPVLNFHKQEGMSKPFAAWNTNIQQRKQSASGGIFAALATAVLRKGGSVYGAAIDGFDVRHVRITDEKDLPLLQGTKYQHSDMTGTHKQVKKDLQQGLMVLFCGMSCQVAGLLSFLGKTNKDNLYTVDTICGGLSTMLPMLKLKESGKYIGIKSFRDKENGWQSIGFKYSLKMIRKDGNIDNLGLYNPVLDTFSSKLLKRSSCLDCKFNGFHRQSDCTIGDFWGDQQFKEQHNEGLSVLVVHDERIRPLLEKASLGIAEVAWKEVVANNHNLNFTHYPAIRHFPYRRKVLNTIRNSDMRIALRQLESKSLQGLILRVYLKIQKLIMLR